MIVDYSTSRPSIGTLKAHDVTAVGRYIGWDGVPGYANTGKNLSVHERDEYYAAAIEIFLAFEYAADAASGGEAQGDADGKLATTQCRALAVPDKAAVYFAVDYDVPDYAPTLPDEPMYALAKLGPVGRYFEAINKLPHAYRVGVYGGYYAVKRLFDARLVELGWQTPAWSGGHMDSRVCLFQTLTTSPFPGSDIDIREHQKRYPDFGQFGKPVLPPPVDPGKWMEQAIKIPAGYDGVHITVES